MRDRESAPPQKKKPQKEKGKKKLRRSIVVVPQKVWPQYECKENGGQGWTVKIMSMNAKKTRAVVRFLGVQDNGEPWADEELKYSTRAPNRCSKPM